MCEVIKIQSRTAWCGIGVGSFMNLRKFASSLLGALLAFLRNTWMSVLSSPPTELSFWLFGTKAWHGMAWYCWVWSLRARPTGTVRMWVSEMVKQWNHVAVVDNNNWRRSSSRESSSLRASHVGFDRRWFVDVPTFLNARFLICRDTLSSVYGLVDKLPRCVTQ